MLDLQVTRLIGGYGMNAYGLTIVRCKHETKNKQTSSNTT